MPVSSSLRSAALAAVVALAVVASFALGSLSAGAGEGAGEAGRSAIGPMISESSYVAITPCRVVDTRKGGGGSMVHGNVRHWDVRGALSGQGGSSNCRIPSSAESIAANLTAVDPLAQGFLRAKAFDGTSTLPNATVLNYDSSLNATNGTPLPLCRSNCSGGDITIGAFANRTHVVVDVVGYWVPPMYAVVETTGPLQLDAAKRISGVARTNGEAKGGFDLTVGDGTDVRGCAILATAGSSDDVDFSGPAIIDVTTDEPNIIEVDVADVNGDPVDADFIVHVSC